MTTTVNKKNNPPDLTPQFYNSAYLLSAYCVLPQQFSYINLCCWTLQHAGLQVQGGKSESDSSVVSPAGRCRGQHLLGTEGRGSSDASLRRAECIFYATLCPLKNTWCSRLPLRYAVCSPNQQGMRCSSVQLPAGETGYQNMSHPTTTLY